VQWTWQSIKKEKNDMKELFGMRIKRNMLFVCAIFFSLSVFGQDLRVLNTKDLIGISEKYGLDSVLVLTKGISIFYIDQTTTEQLVKHIKKNKPSYNIENFLVDYALCVKKANHSEVLHEYFRRKKDEIKDYNANDYYGSLPEISQNSLFALIENSSKQTDSLLLEYYELWNEKLTYYKQDYEKGLKEKYGREKEKLMSPYEDGHCNCYILQRFLKEMGSPLYDQEKLEYHQKNLVSYLRDGFAIGKNVDCSRYSLKSNIHNSIKLTKSYNSIGDIDFDKEVELKKLFNRYNESDCWKFIVFNYKNGYLDLGCQSGPLAGFGIFYWLELKNDNLIIHELYTWVS
jgi:hypothetical protein